MLSVLRVHLPSDIPIVGCDLTPYVLLKRLDKPLISDDVTESNPIDGHFLRYKWSVFQTRQLPFLLAHFRFLFMLSVALVLVLL